jgi:DNA-binding NtrC family response regulator
MLSSELLKLTIIGDSLAMIRTRKLIGKVANYQTPVLIKGETGTGKELVARGIHYSSDRHDAPFVPVNCGAFNDELFLSELFGHEKGAFTDAKKTRPGLLEQADGGTIFLDEVDSLSPKAQVSLLRFLQENEFRSLGSGAVKKVNVRVLTATNKDLFELIQQGAFREDLYYRLDVLGIDVPPLRKRGSDILVLAENFLEKFSVKYRSDRKELHEATRKWFMEYSWPGNVRELENYLHRLFILIDDSVICIPDIKGEPVFSDARAPDYNILALGPFRDEKNRAIENFERLYIHSLLNECVGNISQAAKKAGKERRAFGKLVKKYGIDRENYSPSQF